MTFTTTLFKILDQAEKTFIDGFEIERLKPIRNSAGIRAICDQDNEWMFDDQQVTVDDHGEFVANAIDVDDSDKTYCVKIVSKTLRPIIESDITG